MPCCRGAGFAARRITIETSRTDPRSSRTVCFANICDEFNRLAEGDPHVIDEIDRNDGGAILVMRTEPVRIRQPRGPHWEMLAIAMLTLVLALLLEVRADDRVAFSALPSHPLPETCACRMILGIPCPGCGLTRSFVHLARGRWVQSWQAHHLGWLLAGALLFQFPYRFAALRWPQRRFLGERFPRWFGRVLIVLLIANWAMVLITISRASVAG
jgi:Protein of unknown function (DUF2752)